MADYEQFFSTSFGAAFVNNIGTNSLSSTYLNSLGTLDDPYIHGSAWSDVANGVDMTAGGTDLWNADDHGYYAARPVTGNFDVKVRVAAITNEYGKGFTDTWEKAAILGRVSTNANSRDVVWAVGAPFFNTAAGAGVAPNPVSGGYGANQYVFGLREATGAAMGYSVSANIPWPTNTTITPWLRLVRLGSVFYGYRSMDGMNWLFQGARDTSGTLGGAFPDTIWLGLAATARFNSTTVPMQVGTAKVKFRDLYMPLPASILVQPSPATTIQDWTIPLNMSYKVVVNNPANSGHLSYQWRKNNVAIRGANSDTLSFTNAMPLDVAGRYDVIVANDGGGAVSTSCVIIATNAPPRTSAEAFTTVQNAGQTYAGSTVLLPNDIDPEGAGLTTLRVSGIPPVTFFADFENGLPPGAAIYGTAYLAATNGFTNGGCLHLTDAAGNQAGSLIISNLAPGRRVASFSASFKMRIGNGSPNPADGFSFNFAPDLPDAGGLLYVNPPNKPAGIYGAEEGIGSGLCINVDNYNNGLSEAPAIEVKYNGLVLAAAPLYPLSDTNYYDYRVDLWPDGTVDVYLTNSLVLARIQTPYVPTGGRFGFYARTSAQYETHWLDNVSITAYTVESSIAGSVNYAANFNSGTFVNATNYGNASVLTNGADVFMQLNPATASQAGSFIINELTPGAPVASFMASFKMIVGQGSSEPADGWSFNFASDLPSAATGSTSAEEGLGTGLSVCFDNYRASNSIPGLNATAAFKVKYYGNQFATQQTPVWKSSNWVQITVYLKADGRLDLMVDGTNVFKNIATAYVPKTGRFGFYARTGGSYEAHWLDDVNLTAYTYGTAVLTNQAVVYTPPTNGCGHDSFYYVVSDPQGGMTLDMATVQVTPANPQPPVIVNCATNMTVFSSAGNCQAAIPDLSLYSGLVVTDNCCCVNITQAPAAGTLVNPGVYTVVITATGGASGLSSYCANVVTVLDKNPPLLSGCPVAQAFGTDPGLCTAAVSWASPVAADPCDGAVPVICAPPSGTAFPTGTTTVSCSATDSYGNTASCSFTVTVSDTTPPQLNCANMVAWTSAGRCDQVVNYSVTATDNCAVTNLVCIPPSGTTFAVGPSNVTCTATDSSGNIGTCSFTVTINDPQNPVITTCAPAQTLTADAGGTAALPDLMALTVATDNCGTPALSQAPTAGTLLAVGSTNVVITATDASGNTATCNVAVVVQAGSKPVLAISQLDTGEVKVYWTAPATGWRLYSAPEILDPGTVWTPVSPSLYITNGGFIYILVTDPGSKPDKFYRLKNP